VLLLGDACFVISQQDYLHKISLKMLSLETKANGNALQARGAGGVPGQAATNADPAGK
jgi:hypothetical protein